MFSMRISCCTTKGIFIFIDGPCAGLLSIYLGWVLQSSFSLIILQAWIHGTGPKIGSIKFGAFPPRKTDWKFYQSLSHAQNLLTCVLTKTSGVWLLQKGAAERTRTKKYPRHPQDNRAWTELWKLLHASAVLAIFITHDTACLYFKRVYDESIFLVF